MNDNEKVRKSYTAPKLMQVNVQTERKHLGREFGGPTIFCTVHIHDDTDSACNNP